VAVRARRARLSQAAWAMTADEIMAELLSAKVTFD
jgi:hypothetical protein